MRPAPRATQRPQAEALAARLPALLAEADRVASTAFAGVHGRRRPGQGDSFWQFRPLTAGEPAARIDWRQSARSTRLFVRETEWDAAQTVCLWCDNSASMDWRSNAGLPFKRDRAVVLTLALGMLLLRGGEHLRLLGAGPDAAADRFGGRQAVERLARRLLDAATGPSLPVPVELPAHARLVLVGDFLSPLPAIDAMLAGFAALPVSPLLVQVLDPAEASLPYDGRVRFEGPEGEAPLTVSQVRELRAGYAAALDAHRGGLAALCAAAGTRLLRHDTNRPPQLALLALHQVLARGRGR